MPQKTYNDLFLVDTIRTEVPTPLQPFNYSASSTKNYSFLRYNLPLPFRSNVQKLKTDCNGTDSTVKHKHFHIRKIKINLFCCFWGFLRKSFTIKLSRL